MANNRRQSHCLVLHSAKATRCTPLRQTEFCQEPRHIGTRQRLCQEPNSTTRQYKVTLMPADSVGSLSRVALGKDATANSWPMPLSESGSQQSRNSQLPACHFAESCSWQRSVHRQLFTAFPVIPATINYIQYTNKHFKSHCLTPNSHNHYINELLLRSQGFSLVQMPTY